MKVKITLAELLNAKNVTQRELARQTGMRLASVNEMCLNKIQHLPLENLAKICKTLDCEIPDVLILEKEDRQD